MALHELLESVWYRGHPLKWLLLPLALVFEGAVRARRALYRRGSLERVDCGVPVVVVGNLTVGGTGKTPCTIWLAARLRERGFHPGIVCRGYRGGADAWPQWVTAESDAAQVGDEAVLLARRTGCPVAAGPDRIAAVRLLLERAALDVVLSDDGLQHLRMARAAEIAVVDGERGLGNGLCLPAGPLREPAERLREMDAVVVNGAIPLDAGAGAWLREVHGSAGAEPAAVPRAVVARAQVAAAAVRHTRTGAMRTLDDFKGRRVHALAAIGNPQRFFAMLEAAGLSVVPHPLPDHAAIRAEDLRFEEEAPVMITEKDEVKCRGCAHDDVWCVVAELEFPPADAARLERAVLDRLERAP